MECLYTVLLHTFSIVKHPSLNSCFFHTLSVCYTFIKDVYFTHITIYPVYESYLQM